MMTPTFVHKLKIAKRVTSVSLHPDTGELLPWPFRFSSFIPMTLPLDMGLILAKPTIFNSIFWQTYNQTYKALLNYYNRNATATYTVDDIMKSYVAAMTASLGL